MTSSPQITPMLRAALVVPSAIALIFALFNLTAAPDPARIAAALPIGVVNGDAGLSFPPVNLGAQLIAGFAERLPGPVMDFPTETAARAALASEQVVAVILLPEDFSAGVRGEATVGVRILISGSATAAAAQVAASLPGMIESGMAAAVAQIRLALSQGRLPDLAPPVAVATETLNPAPNPAARTAPGVAVFVLALAGMVGAMITNLATRGAAPVSAALARSLMPVLAMPLAAGVMAGLILGFAGVGAGSGWGLWLAMAGLGLGWAWASAGVFALAGPAGLVVLLPLVFYQSVLGGAALPPAAAPDWLIWLAPLGFDAAGAHLRTLILGGPHGFPWGLAASGSGLGLALIWLAAAWPRPAA